RCWYPGTTLLARHWFASVAAPPLRVGPEGHAQIGAGPVAEAQTPHARRDMQRQPARKLRMLGVLPEARPVTLRTCAGCIRCHGEPSDSVSRKRRRASW